MLLPRALSKLVALALLGAWFTAETSATSWIACIDHNYDAVFTKSDDWVRAGAFGRGACEGYVYNYPGFTDDKGVVDSSWKVDTKKLKGAHAPICQYKQRDATYNDWRREIHAQPGDKLFVGYMPNGHVVRDGKGVESTWGVYWSGDADHELTNASELTQDRLVDGTLNNFDDGNCGLTHTSDGDKSGRAGDPKPCVGSFSIPSHTKPGRYQMVWYWTAQGTDGDKVAYSSCFDVIIKDHQQDMDRCGVDRDAKTTAPPQTADPLPTVAPTTMSPPPARTTRSPLVGRVRPATFAAASTNTLSSFSAPLVAVTYNGVGGSGLYGKVTVMDCPSTNTCTQSDFAVSGPMAPFDEDLTLALRGPLGIDGVSVFTSADGSVWSRASSYSKQDASSDNMVFLNNKGDPLKSGVFDTCNGNSQSYATSDGTTAASAATPFSGVLDDGVEVNIMSSHSCAESGTCGVTRGVAQQGWSGNNKIFMIKGTMPNGPSGSRNLPAIWLLNGQIVRTAQYGCNCRGVGDSGQWKGGCGEIDVAETLAADPNSLTSTMYSFKGSRGTSSYAPRPVDDAVVFVVILTEHTTTGSTSLGMAQILMMWPEDVDMTTPPTNDQVQQWLSYRNGVQVDFDI